MSTGAMIVIGLRLVVPLMIFRWKLTGGIVAMLLDGADVIILDALNGAFGLGTWPSFGYHNTDKILDVYYLSIEAIVALGWKSPWARWPAVVLFVYRIIGVIAFEVTGARIVLFFTPNMFENWWLYCVIVERLKKKEWYPHSWQTVVIPMLLLLIPKMGQEYLLHFAKAQPWNWFKRTVLGQ